MHNNPLNTRTRGSLKEVYVTFWEYLTAQVTDAWT